MKAILRIRPSVVVLSLATCIAPGGCSFLIQPGPNGLPAEEVDDVVNAYTCRCECSKGQDDWERDFTVCLPDDLNPNRGGTAADQMDLEEDCAGRVRRVAVGIAQTCVAENIRLQDCECIPFLEGKLSDLCDNACDSEELELDCSNQDTASTIPGEEPLCLADGEPVSAAFLLTSTCQVEGEITIDRDGSEDSEPATGVVEFTGVPCPGSSCEVDLTSRIDHVGTFNFDGFGGVFETRIDQMRAIGASLAPALVDASGTGFFVSESILSTGRGRRRDFLAGGIETGSDTAAYVGLNANPVETNIDWSGGTCMVDGALFGELEDSDASMRAVLTGQLVNQPPQADAGPDRSVECTSPDGAEVTLDATGSTDPDDNIVLTQWRRGGPGGPEIGELEEIVQLLQPLASTEQYVVNVLDALWQTAQASVVISVVDTTSPEIDCNAPATIVPSDAADEDEPDAPAISFTATASDACDADVDNGVTVPHIETYTCFYVTPSGRRIDKQNSCVVELNGDTITIVDSGGIGTHIAWRVVVTDASGNEADTECELEVIRPH